MPALRIPASAICLALFALPLLAETQQVIPLWKSGAPGFESRRDEPEQHQDWWYKNIHNPSLTVFLPAAGKANGTAVVVAAGGGHRELVFNPEGVEPAQYLASLGVTAFALKYRLFREPGSKYTIDNTAEDIRRAMRTVRARAAEWHIDPKRVGVMGWSAGGEVAALVAYPPVDGDARSPDPVERVGARPDFQILVYPGPLGIPDEIPASFNVDRRVMTFPSGTAAAVSVAGMSSIVAISHLLLVGPDLPGASRPTGCPHTTPPRVYPGCPSWQNRSRVAVSGRRSGAS